MVEITLDFPDLGRFDALLDRPWDDFEALLPRIDEAETSKPAPALKGREWHEAVCGAYAPEDAGCAEDLSSAESDLQGLPREERQRLWGDALRRHGIDPAARDPTAAPAAATHGNPDEQPPSEWGPKKWRELEEWARSIPCLPCRDFGARAASAIHDVVNVKLGKPVYDPTNLRWFADVVKETAPKG